MSDTEQPPSEAAADTGWRKAAVTIATIAALTILQAIGQLTPEVGFAIGGLATGYLGYNVVGRWKGWVR